MPATKPSPTALGTELGWADAKSYAKGDKRQRAAIRRRIAKSMAWSNGTHQSLFWAAYRGIFDPIVEGIGQEIRAGRLPRTIAPSKLFSLTRTTY